MLEAGGQYKTVLMHSAATGTGDGTAMECTEASGGAHKQLTMQVQGISGDTITWEATIDGSNWKGLLVTPLSTGTAALTATADGLYRVDVTGLVQFRARISTYGAGTITVTGMLTAV